jgi:hypothetical protein
MNPSTIWYPVALLTPFLAIAFGTAEARVLPPRVQAAVARIPDLCAELDRVGNPARCRAVGPDMAPWWDGEVCCDGDRCTEPTSTGCARTASLYWCASAILYRDGSLDCVYEVPGYCEVFPCPRPITAPPLEHAVCCHESGCYDHEGGLCGGLEVWCGKGVTNDDGTISCFDEG